VLGVVDENEQRADQFTSAKILRQGQALVVAVDTALPIGEACRNLRKV
jgi:hypothetical protein